MDVPPLWSFLFFFMMINLALSSICRYHSVLQCVEMMMLYLSLIQINMLHDNYKSRQSCLNNALIYKTFYFYSGVQTFMAFILDERPELTKHRLKILIGSCSIYFLLALPMCFRGGMHLFKVFDSRCSSSLLLLSLIEVRNSIEKNPSNHPYVSLLNTKVVLV